MQAEQLIQLVAKGDEAAFGKLYELFKDRVYNTGLHYLQQVPEAEEITQDVFIEVYRSASAFKGQSQVSTWIYRLTVNKCLDKIRYNNRQKRFAFVTSLFHKDTGALVHDSPAAGNPGATLEDKERSRLLQQAISQLPENQRTAFILKQVERLSQKEIAEIMELGEKAVESLIQRAKANLRKLLGDIYDKKKD